MFSKPPLGGGYIEDKRGFHHASYLPGWSDAVSKVLKRRCWARRLAAGGIFRRSAQNV